MKEFKVFKVPQNKQSKLTVVLDDEFFKRNGYDQVSGKVNDLGEFIFVYVKGDEKILNEAELKLKLIEGFSLANEAETEKVNQSLENASEGIGSGIGSMFG
ncbi:MAG: hypothetical protein KAS30_02910 [Candidatus Diapherotrites archaeon]|nr:hypothetical protein [Candidatus Diapherotrites archaeon]